MCTSTSTITSSYVQLNGEKERGGAEQKGEVDTLSSSSFAAASSTTTATAPNRPHLRKQGSKEEEEEEEEEKKKKQKQKNKKMMKKKRPQRPSLSEQLASIGSAAEAVTHGIRSKFGLPGARGNGNGNGNGNTASSSKTTAKESAQSTGVVPLLECPARGFTVGKLRAKSGTTVTFTRQAAEYVFFHPFAAAEIRMRMFYDNMESPEVIQSRRLFRFRINKQLDKFRGDHYPQDRRCFLEIEFAAHSAMREFAQKVLPEVRKRCAGR